jgi:hypothetical protein
MLDYLQWANKVFKMGVKKHCSRKKTPIQCPHFWPCLRGDTKIELTAPILVRASSPLSCVPPLSLVHLPAVVSTAVMAAQTFYLGAKCGGGAEVAAQRRGGNPAGGGGAAPSQASVAGARRRLGVRRHRRLPLHHRHCPCHGPRERERGERRSSWRRGGRRVQGSRGGE